MLICSKAMLRKTVSAVNKSRDKFQFFLTLKSRCKVIFATARQVRPRGTESEKIDYSDRNWNTASSQSTRPVRANLLWWCCTVYEH
jgi:hypothetical protein